MKNIEKLSIEDLVDEAAYYGSCNDDRSFCDYDLFDIEQEINRRIRQAKIDVLEEIVVEAKTGGI
jgi:hypothetical protein